MWQSGDEIIIIVSHITPHGIVQALYSVDV